MSDTAGMENHVEVEADVSAPVDNGNPAWNPVYEDVFGILPEGLHDPVKERLARHFSEWDKNVQGLTEKVHSEYSDYRPFREAGWGGQELTQAAQLYQAMRSDPRAFYDNMREHYKFEAEQGQQGSQPGDNEYDLDEHGNPQPVDDPRLQELAQGQATIAQYLAGQQQAQEAAEADAQLDHDVKSLKAKYGEFDEQYVFNVAATQFQKGNANALEDAVKSYVGLQERVRSTPRPGDSAPLVMPTGGGVPQFAKNPAELSDAERRAAATAYLTQANQANR